MENKLFSLNIHLSCHPLVLWDSPTTKVGNLMHPVLLSPLSHNLDMSVFVCNSATTTYYILTFFSSVQHQNQFRIDYSFKLCYAFAYDVTNSRYFVILHKITLDSSDLRLNMNSLHILRLKILNINFIIST